MRRAGLDQDELVESLVPDPSDVAELKMLFGWLGRSAREGCWRLYLSPELDHYVEVREDDVLHARRLMETESPTGGTILWARRNAPLREIRTGSVQAQASFLAGDIMAILKQADAQARFDLSAAPPQLAATTPFCFTVAVTAGVIIGVGISKIGGSCKKIRSKVFPSQC